MSATQSQPMWELRLLLAAQEAFNSTILGHSVQADDHQLAPAYEHCMRITRYHSRTFFVASALLPRQKRLSARALYAFCRITDDIVDNASSASERIEKLEAWRMSVMGHGRLIDERVELAWADTQVRFNIPHGYVQQLIEGVARDFKQTRYQSFAELAEYSYGVASTVGLMAMHITGFSGRVAIPYAIKLGVALQMTNILRDVADDWLRGRVYLPQDELHAFGLSEDDIAYGKVTSRWREFMRFQIERNRQLYHEARPGIAMLDSDGRFAIGAAAGLYEAILSDIEAHDYDVFSRRSHIGKLGKLARLPGIWLQSQRLTM